MTTLLGKLYFNYSILCILKTGYTFSLSFLTSKSSDQIMLISNPQVNLESFEMRNFTLYRILLNF